MLGVLGLCEDVGEDCEGDYDGDEVVEYEEVYVVLGVEIGDVGGFVVGWCWRVGRRGVYFLREMRFVKR